MTEELTKQITTLSTALTNAKLGFELSVRTSEKPTNGGFKNSPFGLMLFGTIFLTFASWLGRSCIVWDQEEAKRLQRVAMADIELTVRFAHIVSRFENKGTTPENILNDIWRVPDETWPQPYPQYKTASLEKVVADLIQLIDARADKSWPGKFFDLFSYRNNVDSEADKAALEKLLTHHLVKRLSWFPTNPGELKADPNAEALYKAFATTIRQYWWLKRFKGEADPKSFPTFISKEDFDKLRQD